jgi:RNA polymerase sigma-70 factor (ECF subfamily)
MSDLPQEDLQDILARARGGEIAAMEQLLLAQHDRLLKLIRRNLPMDMDRLISPEDLLQETFADAFRYWGTLQARDWAGFSAWLTAIARNRVANARKAHRTLKRGQGRLAVPLDGAVGSDDESTAARLLEMLSRNSKSPRSVAGDREYISLVRRAMSELPGEYQEILRLRFIEQADYVQIARQMERAQGAARMLAFRALRALRVRLPRLWESRSGQRS